MLIDALKQFSQQRLSEGLHRQRQGVVGDAGLQFSSNDYLSLSHDPRIKKAYQHGFEHYPSGSGGSMLVSGYHPIHQRLEQAFSEALGVDDCLIFSSGYAANLSIMALLGHFNTHVLIDKSVHASLYDGLRLSEVPFSRYLHQDQSDMALKIEQAPKNTVMVTEGIFSMSGQYAPLTEMVSLGKHHGLQGLLVDEAHAFGVMGSQGMGAVVSHGLTQTDVPLRIIPLGKAYAACGAVVAGAGAWIDALLQVARPYIYSTAISPAYTYGLLETLAVIQAADDRRKHLSTLVTYFRDAIQSSPFVWRDSSSPIQQLQLGCPNRALRLADQLREEGILCLPIRQPTVNKQETGLRVILNYQHQPEDIDRFLRGVHA